MSGVEAAGLVLGAIPLVLAGLEFYCNGISITKRYFHYQKRFNMLVKDLRTEHTVYCLTIQTLLTGVVSHADMRDFLSEPCGDRWKEGKFEKKLKERLGSTYQSYTDTIEKLNSTVEDFKKRLKLGPSGIPQFAELKVFKEHYKRLKFSINKADYDDLISTIRDANTILHRLTTQTRTLESLQDTRKSKPQAVPSFKKINDRANSCYSALSYGFKCPCQASHSVSLRLEARTENVESEDEDEEDGLRVTQDPFHILLGYDHHQSPKLAYTDTERPWYWEEVDVRLTLAQSVASASPQLGASRTKGVRFANEAKQAVQAALDRVPDMQPIQDLCAAISQLQRPQRDVCFELLVSELEKQKYGLRIYPVRNQASDPVEWSVSSLGSILRDKRFPKKGRLQLAVVLASSVLQLHHTPWLGKSLEKDHIFFLQRSKEITYGDPFLSRESTEGYRAVPSSTPDLTSGIIRNHTLFELGVLLVEIWFGKTIDEMHQAQDGPMDSGDGIRNLVRFNTAVRLLNDDEFLYAGVRYREAVERCLKGQFGDSPNDLGSTDLQDAVYTGVVAKLKETLDFLDGY